MINATYCKQCKTYFGDGANHEQVKECFFCECSTAEVDISASDMQILIDSLYYNGDMPINDFNKLVEAMIALKEKDIIEYELKMSQFRNQANQQQQTKAQSKTSNLPKCPRCGSTSITAGQRGYNIMWGFLGSGNTVNRCANCGHKWKP